MSPPKRVNGANICFVDKKLFILSVNTQKCCFYLEWKLDFFIVSYFLLPASLLSRCGFRSFTACTVWWNSHVIGFVLLLARYRFLSSKDAFNSKTIEISIVRNSKLKVKFIKEKGYSTRELFVIIYEKEDITPFMNVFITTKTSLNILVEGYIS